MKILHFYKTSFPDTMGGIEQVINQIASGCNQHNVVTDVLSLTPHRSPRLISVNGYSVHRARLDLQFASTGFSFSAFLRFSQLAKNADVIHYHFPWPFMDLVHFATKLKKPTVVTYHSDIIRQKFLLKLYRPLMFKFLSNVSHIVATSPNYLATSDVLDKFQSKVSVIPIGLNKKMYPEPTEKKLSYWGTKFGSKFFLFVGVLRYYKGLNILMEAAQSTDYPIVIVGAGPIIDELKTQIIKLRLNNVFLLGYLNDDDKVALLTLCLGIVFPSYLRSEAFGVSLLEGAMFGKPMISSEIGTGTSFININGETGLVVPPSNPLALREAMNYLWENPERAYAMGRSAEARYWQYFTSDKMVNSYVDLYQTLLKNKI